MELTKEQQRKLALKLQQSRLRIMEKQPFYGLLLLYMKFSLDINAGTAYTDGERIAFAPVFLDTLSDSEVDFVLCHEILHTALSHVTRGEKYKDNIEQFNIAADIVVNSNIYHSNGDDINSITLHSHGECMHKHPNGNEGYLYSVEEIYPEVVRLCNSQKGKKKKPLIPCDEKTNTLDSNNTWDNHDKWESSNADNQNSNKTKSTSTKDIEDMWLKRMIDATELINSLPSFSNSCNGRGLIPAFMERIINNIKKGQLDWRTMLQNFVQEDITDYSFSPPDKRFLNESFFLPDFNEKEDFVKNILFMIDTSGSMSDDLISDAFSEVNEAITQFNGKMQGFLGFFDAKVYEPLLFEDVDDLLQIKPKGGGGTSFDVIFDYIASEMDEQPSSIIILTDGYAPIPDEEVANGIPVLWLINNEDITPEWGIVTRIKPNTNND